MKRCDIPKLGSGSLSIQFRKSSQVALLWKHPFLWTIPWWAATWERLKKLLDSSQTLLNYNCWSNLFNSTTIKGWVVVHLHPKDTSRCLRCASTKVRSGVSCGCDEKTGWDVLLVHSHGATPKLAGWCHGKSLWKISGWWLGVPPWLGSFPTWTSQHRPQ